MPADFATAALLPPLLYAVMVALFGVRAIRTVPSIPPGRLPREKLPRLSVIVPACNEAATLATGLESKLASDYPDLEVIVVDDRSTDETGAIADAMAARDRRLKVVHITELPPGWLGKLHALHRGAEAATGEILLFSDADVAFSKDALARAVSALRAEQIDFIALVPHVTGTSALLDASITTFLRVLVTTGRIWKMNDPRSRVAVGAGVFNLVTRSAYEASPRWEWLRMEVAEDVAFGQMLKRSGARCALYNARDDVTLSYYESLGALVRGLEKNSYASSGYRLGVAVPMLGTITYLELAPVLLLPWLSGPAFALALAAPILVSATQVALAKWCGRPLLSAAVPLFGALVLLWTVLRCIVLAHARGGIYWRGTFYPLSELQKGARLERV